MKLEKTNRIMLYSTSSKKRRKAICQLRNFKEPPTTLIILGITDENTEIRNIAKEFLTEDQISKILYRLEYPMIMYDCLPFERLIKAATFIKTTQAFDILVSLSTDLICYHQRFILEQLSNFNLSEKQIIKIINMTNRTCLSDHFVKKTLLNKMGVLTLLAVLKSYLFNKNKFAYRFLVCSNTKFLYNNQYSLAASDWKFLMKYQNWFVYPVKTTLIEIYHNVEDDLNLPPLEELL